MTTEERLQKLERELEETKNGLTSAKRRNRWIMGGVACLILGGITIAATPGEKIIRANKFILEDENGKLRAALGALKDGPGLALGDETGEPRAMLSVLKDGPGLVLSDETGKPIWKAP